MKKFCFKIIKFRDKQSYHLEYDILLASKVFMNSKNFVIEISYKNE